MAEINDLHGSGNAAPPPASLSTTLYTGDAFFAGLIACMSFVGFAIINIVPMTTLGLIVGIANLFCLWYWVPRTITFFKVWKTCLNFSSK